MAEETQGEHRDISNKEIRGVTVRLLVTIFVAFAGVAGGGMKAYYNVVQNQHDTRAALEQKQEEIDELRRDLNAVELKQSVHDAQFIKIDDRFYNLKTKNR